MRMCQISKSSSHKTGCQSVLFICVTPNSPDAPSELSDSEWGRCLLGNLGVGFTHTLKPCSSNTPRKAVFAGSMQLLAGVKLCTGRTLTNHPHYEDKSLRERTQAVRPIFACAQLSVPCTASKGRGQVPCATRRGQRPEHGGMGLATPEAAF